jgi:hypothetical protein
VWVLVSEQASAQVSARLSEPAWVQALGPVSAQGSVPVLVPVLVLGWAQPSAQVSAPRRSRACRHWP